MKYKLELNEKQIMAVYDALEFYERVMGLGQVEEIEQEWRMRKETKIEDISEKSELIRFYAQMIKKNCFGLEPNTSFGVTSKEVPEKFKICYDIFQVIRRELSDNRLRKFEREGNKKAAD